jgi:hypothetical protein
MHKTKFIVLFFVCGIILSFPTAKQVFSAAISNFTQTINANTLSIDIVDDSFASVASPAVQMSAVTFSFACQSATGTFGTNTERIYVKNPDAADSGWTASIAGSNTTAVWDAAAADFDFNDAATSGCTDGADTDSVGGQMTVDASVGTIQVGECAGCAITNISLGSQASFAEGTVDSITLMDAAADSNDIGDWYLTGVSVAQTIPAEQLVASDYDINMVLSIIAK